jgi:ankyrin repeat protein
MIASTIAKARALGGLLALAALLAAAPSDAPVADAAMRGDVDKVRELLRQGADVNAALPDGMTALHWAAERGDVPLLNVVIAGGALLNPLTRIGDYTPLHLAARQGRTEAVLRLLEAGASARAVTKSGTTALHLAAQGGDAAMVTALLDHGAEVDATESARRQTPLMFAAAAGRADAIRVLVARGADVGARSMAVDLARVDAVDQLAGQTRKQLLDGFQAKSNDPVGWRPSPTEVQAAVRAARAIQAEAPEVRAVEAGEAGAGPDDASGFSASVGGMGGFSALHHAAREGHIDAALALVDAGAEVNQPSAGDHTTPLLIAAINGQFDLAMALLERGADPNLANDAGATPLYTTINAVWAPKSRYPQQWAFTVQKTGYLDMMKGLLDRGADPNARTKKHLWFMGYTFDQLSIDTRGSTAFWRAAYALDVPAMKLLVERGADPDIPTMAGASRRGRGGGAGADPSGLPPVPDGGPSIHPILAASGVGYGEGYAGNAHRHAPDAWLPAVRYLVEELGADVSARDANGYNAVHHAAARGDNALIEYLVARGADPMAVSRRGQTTVDMANGPTQRIQPFPETIELLESLGAVNNHRCVSC